MGAQTGVGLAPALASTTLTSLGYLRERGAAAALPCLSLRRPAQSASGAALVVVGLVPPATSLAGGTREGGGGSTTAALIWLGATVALALVVLSPGQSALGPASAAGVAGEARDRVGRAGPRFVGALILADVLGTAVLHGGYQSGGALTVAGLATLLANALPIVAAATALGEPVPSGPLGGLRAFGFVAVSAGAFLLAQTRRPRYGSARSSSARAAPRVGARPVGHVRACQEERANVLDIRRSWLVWPYLEDRAQDHFAVWEAVIAIEQRENRPIEAHSVGRGQQVDEARQVQRTVCPGPPARVGHVRASRAPTSLKRRCVEPQQRAGGKLSRPRVPLAESCRPPTGFDQSRGRRAVAETCQPTAPPLVLA